MRKLMALGIMFALAAPVLADILSTQHIPITFEKAKRGTEGVTWSKGTQLTDAGLVLSKSGEAWIQSAKIPAGLAWRPPTAARMSLSLEGKACNVSKTTAAYARYSVDGVHWSTWQPMTEAKTEKDALVTYRAELAIPA